MHGIRKKYIRNPLAHTDGRSIQDNNKPPTRSRTIQKRATGGRGRTKAAEALSHNPEIYHTQQVQQSLFIGIFDIPGSGSPETCRMPELSEIFAELGISQYLEDFFSQGFDTWETILDITESDFDALNVKLGHRRKLQRKIANSRGLSSDRALVSPARNTPVEDRIVEDPRPLRTEPRDGAGVQGAKRKYKRHPKGDSNAPARPPSAYVIFSNKMRKDIEGRNLSFTEIAKLVGENWQSLRPVEKDAYEQQAHAQKEHFSALMSEYKKTSQFTEYEQYLKEFKAKHATHPQATDNDAKRPKFEAHLSHGSATSSGTSQADGDPGTDSRLPVELSPVMPWGGGLRGQNSPTATSSNTLSGYRDSLLASNQHTLPWREGPREEPGVPQHQSHTYSRDQRPPYIEHHSSGSSQFSHRAANSGNQHPVPPLLTSESTTGSTSTTSSAFYSPRTPMDSHVGPQPAYFSQKSPASYENQLPPLNPPSLSPQTSALGSGQFSNSMPPLQIYSSAAPYQTTLPSVRDIYPAANSQHHGTFNFDARSRDLPAPEDTTLDLLAKAAEIANRKLGSGPPP